jgi:AAA-like domain
VKTSRQTNKHYLITKIINHGIKQGYKAVSVDFQEENQDVFTNSEQLLKWFCTEITWQLEIENRIAQYFQELTYSNSQCSNYFQQYLLPEIQTPLVLVLYKVEFILEHQTIANNFFGLLRFWHQNVNNEDIWRKLRLVIVHSKDTFLTVDPPFSVGIRIEFS